MTTFPWTRRQFLKTGVVTSTAIAVPGRSYQHVLRDRQERRAVSQRVPPDVPHALALRAIDAVKSAGAVYADVRLTRTVRQTLNGLGVDLYRRSEELFLDREWYAVGVRAFRDGAWGFAASPFWDIDDVVRLAREAVSQAKANTLVTSQSVDLGTYPVVHGSWTMPGIIDPFSIPMEEKMDYLGSLWALARHLHDRRAPIGSQWYEKGVTPNYQAPTFQRQERIVATIEGSYYTQTVYQTGGEFSVGVNNLRSGSMGRDGLVRATGLALSGKGWDLFLDAKLEEQVPILIEDASALMDVPTKPVEIGRYDVVCDAEFAAAVLDSTLGTATELDRALGDEANSVGTSFLGPHPLALLGTTVVASPLVTITANRSVAGGLATVRWDDEGVVPEDFTLVHEGLLQDYQTIREQAAWLAPYYQKINRPVRSHGCAGAESALSFTMQRRPNLAIQPSTSDVRFNDLVADTPRGLAIMGVTEKGRTIDFQASNGMIMPARVREIVNGKLGASVTGVGILFNAKEFWKNILAVGGTSTAGLFPGRCEKGEPTTTTMHSVGGVALKVRDVTVIDPLRKA